MAHVIDVAKRYKDGLASIEQEHAKNPSGRAIANKHSDLLDEIITELFKTVLDEPGFSVNPGSKDIALIALGGYGRQELCPFSDIDLMILHRLKDKALVTSISEKLFYPLWDLGLQVGHGTRTVKESLAMSSANFELQTSFLEARLITGDKELLTQLNDGLIKQLHARGGKRFLQNILNENTKRHTQFGQAAYLLEPDLKEGEGGLRDIHAILWATKGLLGYNGIQDLTKSGYLTDFDAGTLGTGFEFLLKIRNQLHYISGRKNDRLFFEHQLEVSKKLGFKDSGGISGIEKFMRTFYTHASAIELIQRSFWEQVAVDFLPAKGIKLPSFKKAERDGITLTNGKLSLTSAIAVADHPGSEIKLFKRSIKEGIPFDYKNLGLIREGFEQSPAQTTWTPTLRNDFVEILKAGCAALPALEVMDYLGVISRYIPEWTNVRCLPQYDSYHLYTVDMHMFLTLCELQKMGAGVYDKGNPLLKQVFNEIKHQDTLFITGLLHDIGKGEGKNHSEKGAKLAKVICERMGLSAKENETVVFLVENHLLLAEMAQRRDLNDENVIIDLAETVVHEDRLKMLYLISVADSLATGPKAWDTWKDNLLRELFLKALHIISSGEYTSKKSIERMNKTQAKVKAALSEKYDEAEIDLFLKQMPHSYLLAQRSEDIVSHFEQAQSRASGDVSVSVKRSNGIHEMVLVARDQPGLFSKVSGVLAIHGINILGAQVYTRSNGMALDIFKIAGYFEHGITDDTWEKIQRDIKRALEGKIALEYRIAEKAKRYQGLKRKALKRPVKVEVDNSSSDFYTIIEVHAEDRIGLLYTITRVMFELNLDIHLAKVSTNVDKVIDVFYVWDACGQKLSDAEQISDVKRAIVMALDLNSH